MKTLAPTLHQTLLSACVIVSSGMFAQSVAADGADSADLFVKSCLASVEELARLDEIAREHGWKAEDDQKLAFPLGKRGNPLERKSGWRGTWKGQEFVVVTGVEVTPYETTNACMVEFMAGGTVEEFLAKLTASVVLRPGFESSTPQGRLGLYEVQGERTGKPSLVMVQSRDGTLVAAWAIREQ